MLFRILVNPTKKVMNEFIFSRGEKQFRDFILMQVEGSEFMHILGLRWEGGRPSWGSPPPKKKAIDYRYKIEKMTFFQFYFSDREKMVKLP